MTQPVHEQLRAYRAYDRAFSPWRGWWAALRGYGASRRLRAARPGAARARLLLAGRCLLTTQAHGLDGSLLGRRIARAIRAAYVTDRWAHAAAFGAADDVASVVAEALRPRDGFYLHRFGGIVLKPPRIAGERVIERGALYLTHGYVFRFFHDCIDMPALLRDYTLMLQPGWSAYADRNVLDFTRYPDHDVLLGVSDERDERFIASLGSNIVPLAIGSGDWADISTFFPLPDEPKVYDAVLVAKWAVFKRHHVLLRALRDDRASDPPLRVAMVGADNDELRALIAHFGVARQVEVFGRVEQTQLNRIVNQSRLTLLLALQEGGNRSIFEGYFADVPAVVLRRNVGVNKRHVNAQTGRLIDEHELAAVIRWCRDNAAGFAPRKWALAHIGPEHATRRLNEALQQLATRRREPWTRDIVTMCTRPERAYYPDDAAGRGLPRFTDILLRYARTAAIRATIERCLAAM